MPDTDFQISVGQIVTDKKNDKISPSTSLNDKLSDLVGTSNLKINDNFSLKYNFSLDNNYEDLNYNEDETALNYNNLEFNLGYLQEKKHLGNDEYLKTSLKYKTGKNQQLSIQNKRNLIRDASEYYNLSYEYYNDCYYHNVYDYT